MADENLCNYLNNTYWWICKLVQPVIFFSHFSKTPEGGDRLMQKCSNYTDNAFQDFNKVNLSVSAEFEYLGKWNLRELYIK